MYVIQQHQSYFDKWVENIAHVCFMSPPQEPHTSASHNHNHAWSWQGLAALKLRTTGHVTQARVDKSDRTDGSCIFKESVSVLLFVLGNNSGD